MPKLILTGITSFVGHHLALGFAAAGWEVTGVLSRPRSAYDGVQRQRLAGLPASVELQTLDLRDTPALQGLAYAVRPALWVHHAAHARDYAGFEFDLAAACSVTLLPLYSLYPVLQAVGCHGVLLTGSSMEYSDSEQPGCEVDACAPATPYGLSKLAETLAALQLGTRYELPTRVARLFIPFGPLDAPGKLISYALGQLQEGRSVDLSPCAQQRDFLHVDDVVAAFLGLAGDLNRGGAEVVNVCRGEAVPLRTVLEALAELVGAPRELLRFGQRPMRPGEPPVSYGDNSKARHLLGWNPTPLAISLRRLVGELTDAPAPAGARRTS